MTESRGWVLLVILAAAGCGDLPDESAVAKPSQDGGAGACSRQWHPERVSWRL